MEKKLNFISLVALGNFNPAILTPGFLNDVCQLDLGEPTGDSPPALPVVKQLKYQNISIDACFDRFQIKESDPENIYDTRILEIFSTIFEKLHYTPLRVVGVNVNCLVFYDIDSKMEELISQILKPDTILSYFKVDQVNIQKKYLQVKDEEKWIASNYRIQDVGGLMRSIDIINKKSSYSINYNYEAGNLQQDREKLDLFLDSYKNFCDEFYGFLKHLEG